MQKNALVSSGSCSAGDEDRICLLNGLYAADWSKVRPLIFAIAGDGGVVRVVEVMRKQEEPGDGAARERG